jgi:hypothetical protein
LFTVSGYCADLLFQALTRRFHWVGSAKE